MIKNVSRRDFLKLGFLTLGSLAFRPYFKPDDQPPPDPLGRVTIEEIDVYSEPRSEIRLIQWALPVVITIMAVLYQFGPARYVHDKFGDWTHYALEILFYGTVGPAFVWLTLRTDLRYLERDGNFFLSRLGFRMPC